MKEKIALIFLLVLLSVLFVACNGASTPPVHKHTIVYKQGQVATCADEGFANHYYCKECGDLFADKDGLQPLEELVKLPKRQHKFDRTLIDQKFLASPATCTTKALYYYSCKCGQMGTEVFEDGRSNGHKGVATCTQDAVCTECGATFTNALGHSYVFKVDNQYALSGATCTSNGEYYESCNRCGEAGANTFFVPSLAHSYVATEWYDTDKTFVKTMTCSQDATHIQTFANPTIAPQSYNLASIASSLKLIGRTQTTSNSILCDMTASGISFWAYIAGEVTLEVDCTAETYFTLIVDGQKMEERFRADQATSTISLGNFGSLALHEITILKQSEAQITLSALKKLSFEGQIVKASDDKPLLIEFIGDSITCGYGNLTGVGTANPQSAPYQDGTATYAYLTAQSLNTDFRMISCSGVGVGNGWVPFNISQFYSRLSYYRSQVTAFDYNSVRKPDIIVINLGTNDYHRQSTQQQFKTNAKTFINSLRQNYNSNMPIVWAYNMMGACCEQWILQVISEMGGASNGLYAVQLPTDQAGGGSHPSSTGHINASQTLVNYILSSDILNGIGGQCILFRCKLVLL